MSTTSESRPLLESLELNSDINYGLIESNLTPRHSISHKPTKRLSLEAAVKTRRIVDIPFLRGLLAELKGEDCPGLTTPFNTPVRFGESPFSVARKSPRPRYKINSSNRTPESGYLTSCSLPRYSLAPSAATSSDCFFEKALSKEEEYDSSSEEEPTNHEEFFSHLGEEVDHLLDHIGTRIATLQHEVESVSKGGGANLVGSDLEVSVSEAEDMFEVGVPGSLVHRARLLRRSLQWLSETLSVNMSYLYHLCVDYDRSFKSKRAGQYFTEQQSRVTSSTENICGLIFALDDKIAQADGTAAGDREEGGGDAFAARRQSRKQNLFACFRSIPTLLHMLMFVSTLIVLTVLMDRGPTSIGFYRLFRGPAIIILFIYMVSLNVVVWRLNGIQYHEMFKFDPGSFPTARELADYAGGFAVAFTAFASAFMICFGLGVDVSLDKIFPCIMWGIILAFFFNPTNSFHRQGRWGLMKSLFRVVTAPFHKVAFGDFWLADQLNSLVILLLDVEYLLCYCSVDWSRPPDSQSCGSLTYLYIRPFLSVLPAWFRFMQCLRDFYDSRNIQHALNALKYSSTFFVVVTATLYSLHYPGGYPEDGHWDRSGVLYLVLWSVTSWVRAFYTFAWDVNRDWGLVRTLQRSRFCLREELVYRPQCWYYVVIAVDFVLRISQTLKISLGVFLHIKSDLLFTTLIVLEVIRRFIWNFFRLELQQVIVDKQSQSPTRLEESVSINS